MDVDYDEAVLGITKLEQEEDEEVLDRVQQVLGEDAQVVDGIMMMVGVKHHEDEVLGAGDDVDHGEVCEDDEFHDDDDECHGEAYEDDECHGEVCEDDDPHGEGLGKLVDGDHDVGDGDHGDLDVHKDQDGHNVQDDGDGEGWPL